MSQGFRGEVWDEEAYLEVISVLSGKPYNWLRSSSVCLSMYLCICVFISVGMNVCIYLSSICHFSLNPEKRYEETKNGAL